MDPFRSPSSARRPNLSIQPEMCRTAVDASGRKAAAGSTATFKFPRSGGVTVCVPHTIRYSAEQDKKAALIVPIGTPTLPRMWRCGISIRSGHGGGEKKEEPLWTQQFTSQGCTDELALLTSLDSTKISEVEAAPPGGGPVTSEQLRPSDFSLALTRTDHQRQSEHMGRTGQL